MNIEPFLPPVIKRDSGEVDGFTGRVVVDVVVHLELPVPPVAAEKDAVFEVDNVSLELEGQVRFHTGTLKLELLVEREDVVLYPVLLAVMLVKPAGLGPVDYVVLYEYVGAAFVKVDPPSPVACGDAVVDQVVVDDGSRRDTQRIDSSKVGEPPLSDLVDMIVSYLVLDGITCAVTPRPADGYTGIIEVVDVVVDDLIMSAVSDPHTDGGLERPAAFSYLVVADDSPFSAVSNLYPTGAKVRDDVAGDSIILRTVFKLYCIIADLRYTAVIDGTEACSFQDDRSGDQICSLG